MALSALGALLGVFLPDALWHAIFQIHGLRPVLQSLAPAMVAGACPHPSITRAWGCTVGTRSLRDWGCSSFGLKITDPRR